MKRVRLKTLTIFTICSLVVTLSFFISNVIIHFHSLAVFQDEENFIHASLNSLKTVDFQKKFTVHQEWSQKEWLTLESIQQKLGNVSNPVFDKKVHKEFLAFRNQILEELADYYIKDSMKAVYTVDKWFDGYSVMPVPSVNLRSALNHLSSAKILKAGASGRIGTQLKITLLLEGNVKALFKPKWYPTEFMISGDVYSGKDRHSAEILAFYVGLLLGFRRSPLVAGRVVNLSKEILPVATDALKETFLKNGSDTCFYGVCYYCNRNDAVCGEGDRIEGAVVRWLPPGVKLEKMRSPWARTYSKKKRAKWEQEPSFCSTYKSNSSFDHRLLDIVDAAIFDFILGNGDRHDLEFAAGYENATILLLDNGKSLRDTRDHLDILAPLYQCCIGAHRFIFIRGDREKVQDCSQHVVKDVFQTYCMLRNPQHRNENMRMETACN